MTRRNAAQESVVFEDEYGKIVRAVRHKNPDGTVGGWVPPGFVGRNITLGENVIVYPGVVISEGANIEGVCVIAPN